MNATLRYDADLIRWSLDLGDDADAGPTTTVARGDVTLYAAGPELVGIVVDAPLGAADPDAVATAAVAALVGDLDLRRFRGRSVEVQADPALATVRSAAARAITAFVDDPGSFEERLASCPEVVRAVLPAGTRSRTAPAVHPQVLANAWASSPGTVSLVLRSGGGDHEGTTRLAPRPELRGAVDLDAPVRVGWSPRSGTLVVEVQLAEGAVADDLRDLWLRVARADDGITIAAAPLDVDGEVATAATVLADDDLASVVVDVTDQPFEPAGTATDRVREQAVALMQLAAELDGAAADALWRAAAERFEQLHDVPRASACRARVQAAAPQADEPAPPAPPMSRRSRRRPGWWLAALALVGVVGGLATWRATSSDAAPAATSAPATSVAPTSILPTTTLPTTTVAVTTVPATQPSTSLPALVSGPVAVTTPGGDAALASISGSLRFHPGDTVAVSVQVDRLPATWTLGNVDDCYRFAEMPQGALPGGTSGDGPPSVPSFVLVAAPLDAAGARIGRYVLGPVAQSHQVVAYSVTAQACAAGTPVPAGTEVHATVRLAAVVTEVVLPADLPPGRVAITLGGDRGDAATGLVIDVAAR